MSCPGCSYSSLAGYSSCDSANVSYSHSAGGRVVVHSSSAQYKSSVAYGDKYSSIPMGLDYQVSKSLKELEERENKQAAEHEQRITELNEQDHKTAKNPAQEIAANQLELVQHQNELMQNMAFIHRVNPRQEVLKSKPLPAKGTRLVEVEEQILIKRRKRVVEF